MGWLAAQGAIMAIGLFIGLVCSVIGLFFGHKNGKIKVVLSDIVVRESKRHIADQIKKICGIMRKARAAALEESTEHLISTIGLGEILRIVTNKGELISKGEEMFDDFLRTINTEILGADLIDVGLVLGDYFETKNARGT